MPAVTHLNRFKLLVISLLVAMVSSASGGYRLQFVDRGKRDQKIYQNIRDQILDNNPDVDPVSFFVEPLDAIEIGAWPATAQGILTVAKKSLHFELPSYTLSSNEKSRGLYAKILSELLKQIARSRDFGAVVKLSN